MPSGTRGQDADQARIVLDLLEALERDGGQSQRRLASDLGIALGLVNAYLKRCVKKGLVKVSEVPARRYIYYLTPQGFSEKSRLTVEYLSHSFGFFRQAKLDCSELLRTAKSRGVRHILLVGRSDLAEIAALCAMEQAIGIGGLVQDDGARDWLAGIPVFENLDAVKGSFDCALITEVNNTRRIWELTVARFGPDRVLIPDLLRGSIRQQSRAAE